MAIAKSRRALFARFRGGPAQLRPPWSVAEIEFTESCTQCEACIEACVTGVLTTGHAGYPIVDFANAECTFCEACREACEQGCFDLKARSPWTLKASVSKSCVEIKGVACRVCQDACEASAIRFRPQIGGRSLPEISSGDCTGCGACVATCPVSAISIAPEETNTTKVTS